MPEITVAPKNYLCDIEGLCAVFSKETLNGRSYSQIYRNLLDGKDYRFNEMMKRGGILCELSHPAQETADFERTETDLNKVCAILTEIKEGPNSEVYAKGKVLDTPAGRIYMAMKPFYKFGFSSRGSYDAVDDYNAEGPDGWNQESYVFKGFDIVALPATEASEISATESITSTKKKKSARESLDINEIASAANVTPEEINRELDKMFTEKGDIPGSELVSLREYSDKTEKDSEITPETQENVVEEPETPANPDAPAPEAPVSDIKQDLLTALGEAAKLREQLEKEQFEKQDLRLQLDALKSENGDLLHRAIEAEKSLADYEEIKHLSKQLVDSYHGVKDEYEAEVTDLRNQLAAEQQTSTKWQEEAKNAANEKEVAEENLRTATEELAKYKSRTSMLTHELGAAKENLLDVYSTNYGVAKESVINKIGKNFRVMQIKPAVESLAKESLRLSNSPVGCDEIGLNYAVDQPDEFADDVERELFAALNNDF